MSIQEQSENDQEILALISKGHANDEQRIRAGELNPDSMFFIARERVQQMQVIWNNVVFEEFA